MSDSDERILNEIFGAIKYSDLERYLAEWDFYPEDEYNIQPKNLDEESCHDLLVQLKHKFQGIVALEKALGAELIAELRGFEYVSDELTAEETVNDELTAEETVNDANANCYCNKVVGAEAYEIDDCCRMNGKQSSQQWVGHNSKGEFYVETCSCGMISKPYLAGELPTHSRADGLGFKGRRLT